MDLIDKTTWAIRTGSLTHSMVIDWDHHGQAAWDSCEDARDLLHLLSCVDTRAATRAACACARTVLKYIPHNNGSAIKAIETAERWLRGEATAEQCKSAADVADSMASRHLNGTVYAAVRSAVHAADSASAIDAVRSASESADTAADAVASSSGSDNDWLRIYNQTLRDLADVVRANAACPTHLQLLSIAK